ncbi:MAG: L-2-amino-thiazoline-4-carboxylic acid hydrolase [Oscillospiraceae bacterium]|nr:L-2-amino-thiazoline-4-carboxylic acid hydrolase [Oscillospiraceae bacterium]
MMRAFKDAKVVIIGMGFLMEYIFPCFRMAMGEKTAENVLAVTADAGDVEGKRQRLGIRVLLNDNEGALAQMRPDVIFFAPPPKVAPGLIGDCLKPYFASVRAAGGELPVIFAFPPSPAGKYYQEQLGDDIEVVNIIPNMISRVGGEAVPDEAHNLITFPAHDTWTARDKEILHGFFAPMGGCLDLTPALTLKVLSAEIATHPLTELADAAAQVFTSLGLPCSYADTASAMRAQHQADRGYRAKNTNNCDAHALGDEKASAVLRAVVNSWYDALLGYLTDNGFAAPDGRELLDPLFDLYLHEAQLEDRATIVAKAKKDATKGGMLELCLENYSAVAQPLLRDILREYKTIPSGDERIARFGRIMREITAAVAERGSGLTADKAGDFTPRQHAVMFGVLAKHILGVFGEREGDAILAQGVRRYGLERGSRMAQRCEAAGEAKDMVAYFAFGEISYNWDGFVRTMLDRPYFAHTMRACPWTTAWRETGLEAYGRYYCRCVDSALLEGFNPALHLRMPTYLSKPGSDRCEFHYTDYILDDAAAQRKARLEKAVGADARRDFVYHTAHLYSALTRTARAENAEKCARAEALACDEFARLCSFQDLLKVLGCAGLDFTKA